MTIHKPAAVVYQSLSTNLHHVFTPVTVLLSLNSIWPCNNSALSNTGLILNYCAQVCDDTIEEDDGQGNQTLFRVVRVPFRVVFVSGNLKLRFRVKQSRHWICMCISAFVHLTYYCGLFGNTHLHSNHSQVDCVQLNSVPTKVYVQLCRSCTLTHCLLFHKHTPGAAFTCKLPVCRSTL